MSHNITKRDGLFSVRDAGWHGLAHVFEGYPSRAEAQRIAHPWEPETDPLYRRRVTVLDGVEHATYELVPHALAVYRNDTYDTLGVISDTLELVTNSEMWDIAEVLEGEDKTGEVRYETGGSLRGGAKVWLLLRLREPLQIKGDPNTATIPYYALQNAHDGSGSFRGQATLSRIVCDNTAQMADLDASARGTEFVFRHTRNVREKIAQARTALAGWRTSVREFQVLAEHMLTLEVTPEQRELYVVEFIPMPAPHTISDRVVDNIENARDQLRAILAGPTTATINHTAWGLVQGSIEYAQHERRAASAETRFKRAYLDRDRLTADAVVLARQVVTHA
jgi:phage/plasmid-like protein (TIGR03299 family)